MIRIRGGADAAGEFAATVKGNTRTYQQNNKRQLADEKPYRLSQNKEDW